jgi:hypothetical protein
MCVKPGPSGLVLREIKKPGFGEQEVCADAQGETRFRSRGGIRATTSWLLVSGCSKRGRLPYVVRDEGTWSSGAPAGMRGSRWMLAWNSPIIRLKCVAVHVWR